MYYTYVLQSKKDLYFYIGHTADLRKRLNEHNSGRNKSTANRRPFCIVYYEACLNKNDAIKREKYFKQGFGRRFLNNRLENFLNNQARDGGQGKNETKTNRKR